MGATEEPAPRVVVRPATADDFEALVDLDLASAVHHRTLDPAFYRVPDRADVAAFLRRRMEHPGRRLIVATVGDAVVGVVDVTLLDPPDPGSIVDDVPTADIGISVAERWRGQGIGRALMAAAEGDARARGARRIVLDMSSANEGALRFYRGLGYRPHGLLLRRDLAREA